MALSWKASTPSRLEADVALDDQVLQSSGHLGLTWIRIPCLLWRLGLGPRPGLGVAGIADASEIDGLALRHTGAERGRVLTLRAPLDGPLNQETEPLHRLGMNSRGTGCRWRPVEGT